MVLANRIGAHVRWRAGMARFRTRDAVFRMVGRHRSVVRTRDRHGNVYFVSTRDPFIGRYIFNQGEFESHRIVNTLALLDDRGIRIDRVLDIGANIGTTTIELLTRRPDLTADCFEPEPLNAWLLRRNLAANGFERRAQVHALALSDVDDALLTFAISDANPGDHRVQAVPAGAVPDDVRATIAVPARRLDSLDLKIDERTLACIDVQGHEWNVLAGAPSLAGPITLEFWPHGLARAGAYDALIGYLERWERLVVDITDSPAETDARSLAASASGCSEHWARELLILPA